MDGETNIIQYQNVTKENFALLNFFMDGKEELLLVHEFMANDKKDYAVIGKIVGDRSKVSRIKILQWVSIIQDLVTNYKTNKKQEQIGYQYSYYKLLLNNITASVKFTQEGYDLITNKFLFTDNKMERTVNINRQVIKDGLIFDNKYNLINEKNRINQQTAFCDIKYYDENYFFTPSEKSHLGMDQALAYIRHNPEKLRKALISLDGPWYKNMYKDFKNKELEMDKFLLQVIDAKMELQEQRNKTK
jgi:hypothetical protein